MKIIKKETRESFELYNPTTDEYVVNEMIDETAKDFIGYWIDEVFREPCFNNSVLQKEWYGFEADYVTPTEDHMELEDVEKFLQGYENEDWIVYEIITHGMACGPTTNTVWFVVNKEVIYNEIEY